MTNIKAGALVTVSIYGRDVLARVLVVHPANTIDVEVLDSGRCYRVSGLA